MSKWSCLSCTYDNWPAAGRCVICHTLKPAPRIEDDIYKLALSPTSNSTGNNGGSGLSVGSDSSSSHVLQQEPVKWSCASCTYCNWPRSKRCTQCHTPRPRRFSPSSSTSNSSEASPLRISVNVNAESGAAAGGGGFRRASPRANTVFGKWICRRCTYENWPRSSSCILCQAVKVTSESPSPPPSVSDTITAGVPETGACGGEIIAAAGRSGDGRLYHAGLQESDYLWLCACLGAVEGEVGPVEACLATGGSPARRLTKSESALLNRHRAAGGLSRVFEAGLTLSHLVFRHSKHEDLMALLLAAMDRGEKGINGSNNAVVVKRVPCHTSPELASEIRRHLATCLRQRKGSFPCFFFTETNTFCVPPEVEDLPSHLQDQLLLELADHDVQRELEEEEACINWSEELSATGWRLLALWNRTAGDCLLDSVLQASWGVLDRDNALRWALFESLRDAADALFQRWQQYEAALAAVYGYALEDYQLERDWSALLESARRPGESLEQIHVLTLAHILRRPIIIYGVKVIHNYRAEPIGLSNFQGVYLPLLWERHFCWRAPLLLGYTRGHFSALVPVESLGGLAVDLEQLGGGAGAFPDSGLGESGRNEVFLPLADCRGKLLPVHFLEPHEFGREEALLREWMDCCVTKRGLLCARLRLQRQHSLVHQLSEEWVDHYRRLARVFSSPVPETTSRPASASSAACGVSAVTALSQGCSPPSCTPAAVTLNSGSGTWPRTASTGLTSSCSTASMGDRETSRNSSSENQLEEREHEQSAQQPDEVSGSESDDEDD